MHPSMLHVKLVYTYMISISVVRIGRHRGLVTYETKPDVVFTGCKNSQCGEAKHMINYQFDSTLPTLAQKSEA